jgi:hypothetical protein
MEVHMAKQDTPAPGWAVNEYLNACERILDRYAHGEIVWATMLDERAAAAARLSGLLADHFLIRAHNRQDLVARRANSRRRREEAGR